MAQAETLMTEAPQAPTEGSPASPDVETPAASAADVETSTPAAGEGAEQAADSQTAGEGAGGEEAPAGAPEAYADFDMPEGVTIDPETTTQLKDLARDLNLPQAAAQKVADLGVLMAQRWADQHQQHMQSVQDEWRETTTRDPEIGGASLAENLALGRKALEAFGSDSLKDLLSGSGLGNHPEFIRLFVKVGKAISEDRLVTGEAGPPAAPDDRAKRLFPNQN